ncbi:acyl-CoA dehydrogenase family protein [Hyphomicrobium sp.]|uniref:acyl-CoA dehydrogenase family protein n=1 Tax=Hyphomicrobium sp. TaxID=82 RepID=UPI0025C411E5|nr:acyl-CoA dehydrogenase family protein [Hyphomicrobium sp.]MCC7250726.1 acyl-CoA/acyl-ACP dehydrogenase [Hyphomicrobium sp.]
MNFDLDESQQELRTFALELAGRTEDRYWQAVDEEYRFPAEFWNSLTEQGLLGIALPEEFGGLGKGLLDLTVAVEGVAEGGGGMEAGSLFLGGPVFGGCLLDRHGTREQQEKYLPGLVAGEMWAGAFTEPESGSNITRIRTKATLDGDRYLVNGQKVYISLVRQAKHIVVMARTRPYDSEHRTRGISLLLGDLPDEGVSAHPFKKLGNHFMDTNAVYFTDYAIPAGNVVGEEGNAWGPLYDVLNPERIILAAAAIGTGNLCIRKAVEFALDRKPWGKPIGAYQGLQFPLAKARVALETAKLKVYEAAWLYDQKRDCGIAAAMAKFAAAHAALDAADWAIQVYGGAGYVSESGIERHWRNLRLYRLSPVSDEMTLNYLAQHDLRLPRSY